MRKDAERSRAGVVQEPGEWQEVQGHDQRHPPGHPPRLPAPREDEAARPGGDGLDQHEDSRAGSDVFTFARRGSALLTPPESLHILARNDARPTD